jgi:outer membrane immunogenic protein
MNKFLIITKGALIAMGMVGIADANSGASHNPFIKWTGLYAGVDAGIVFNQDRLKSQQLGFTSQDEHCNISSDYSTFSPGIQLGYMHQFINDLVAGVEAGISFNTNQKDRLRCLCPYNLNVSDSFSFKNQMQGSIKGRVGRALNWNKIVPLPYFTAGASFANVGLSYKNEGGDYYSRNTSQTGWLIGAGIEWVIGKNWSLRAEYNHVGYGNALNLQIPTVYGLEDPGGKARVTLNSNNFAVAINYWI